MTIILQAAAEAAVAAAAVFGGWTSLQHCLIAECSAAAMHLQQHAAFRLLSTHAYMLCSVLTTTQEQRCNLREAPACRVRATASAPDPKQAQEWDCPLHKIANRAVIRQHALVIVPAAT